MSSDEKIDLIAGGEFFYHVVTEKPMRVSQLIIFDDNHHNGVYNRVITYKKIIDGEDFPGELADLIRANLNKWSKVANRELALEKIRQSYFPHYPSRLACLYTTRTIEEAKSWAKYFRAIGREVYSIVKLRVNGKIFDGDASNCFDGSDDEAANLRKAIQYWRMDVKNESPVNETLVDGEIKVIEIIEDYEMGMCNNK